MESGIRESLTEIGLNNLEAEIYITIMKEPSQTGYKISKTIGKAKANVYNALESMVGKGLLLEDKTGSSTLFVTIPLDQYLDKLAEDLKKRSDRARAEISKIKNIEVEDGIYKLKDFKDVRSLIHKMIQKASKFVLIDAFPGPLNMLYDDLADYIEKFPDLKMIVKTYDNRTFENDRIVTIQAPDAAFQLEKWDAEWFIITIDNAESLMICIDQEGNELFEAIWIRNFYLSGIIYNGTFSELSTTFFYNQTLKETPHKEIFVERKKIFDGVIQYMMDLENAHFKKLFKLKKNGKSI